MSHLALAGRRVLELGGWVAAPFAGSILAHLGADVIKVESLVGDPTRTMLRGGPSGTFIAYNHGKRSICIDLASAEGHAVFDRLLETSDVVVHNLSPDAARRLKVTREDCHRVNSQIVYCHITGYGKGPRADEIASNPIIEASTGVMYANRVNGRPTRLGPSYHDMFAGMNAVIGITASLANPERDQGRRHIDIGLYEVGLHVAARDLVGVALNAQVPREKRRSNTTEFGQPGYGSYETSDGRWMYLLILSDMHWQNFCEAMELQQANDPTLRTRSVRRERSEELEALVVAAVRSRTFDDSAARLGAVGVGFAEVRRYGQVLDDPQARSSGKTSQVEYEGNAYTIPTVPIVSEAEDSSSGLPPPSLGQHTREILKTLGYDGTAFEGLVRNGVIIG
jgi:crotonobetainyl-CoA:carnitine CoA-transferase CaiB-like acyl-CoA transferase